LFSSVYKFLFKINLYNCIETIGEYDAISEIKFSSLILLLDCLLNDNTLLEFNSVYNKLFCCF
jgi:hypothetical protein